MLVPTGLNLTFLTQNGPREKKKTETCGNLISDIWRLLLLLFSQFTDNGDKN